MIKKYLNSVLFVILTSILSSCYCYKTTYTASPVDLESRSNNSTTPCCERLENKSFTITPYYGLLNPNKIEANDLTHKRSTFGQVGIQTNYLYAPFKKTPFKIASIGLDLSYINFENYFIDNSFQPYDFDRQTFRVMLNHNFATVVGPRLLGYVNTQIGVKFNRDKLQYWSAGDIRNETQFDFRIGYNFNYFLTKSLILSADAGYGAGSYIKTGLSIWF
ncbi:MAG: hypothetical protein ACPGU5_01165 [Lishizhenia sp.]